MLRDPRHHQVVQYLIAYLEHDTEAESREKICRLTDNDPQLAARIKRAIRMPGYWHHPTRLEPDWKQDYRLERATRILDSIETGKTVIPASLTAAAQSDLLADRLLDELRTALDVNRARPEDIREDLVAHYSIEVRRLARRKADFDEDSDFGIKAFGVLDSIQD